MDDRIKLYFKPQDFVCQDVWRAHGERSWRFFAPRLIDNMAYIRLGLGKPVTVNTWDIGGLYTRGNRGATYARSWRARRRAARCTSPPTRKAWRWTSTSRA